MKWVLQQLHGIADGICTIHNQSKSNFLSTNINQGSELGYHHDISPANLLVFKNQDKRLDGLEKRHGRIVLSDFGLAKVKKHDDQLITGTRTISGVVTYFAPESELKGRGYQGRDKDIWSFGCIMLQIMVWLLQGPEYLGKFDNARYVFMLWMTKW